MKIKSYLGKHKKLFITVSISLIVISLLGGTYAMFQRLDKAEYANNYRTGLLQILFDDTSEGLGGVISVEGAVPMSDSDGVNSTPYKFKIINQGNLDYKFDLKLVIDADYTSTHGCSDNQLNADYIMVKFNDEEPVTLSSLSDNVIKSDIELKVGQDVTYELRAWLKEGTPNTEIGKHYHGKLTTNGNAIYTKDTIPNAPVLAEGMIPIAYDGTNWVKADTNNTDNNWYNYKNKMWANAVMVTSDKRDTYMNANNGTVIPEDDILAYYVWIPRYRYKLFNVDFTSGTSPQVIDVEFVYGTSRQNDETTCQVSDTGEETCQNKANGNWYTHPAFTFGSTELKGIWVGKFETTGSTTTPTVKPGITSLRNINVSSMYSTGQLFRSTDYLTSTGVNEVDAHMMKNIEWGAVAYLKQSAYGLGTTEIAINNSSNYLTGKSSGDPAVTDSSATGSYSYNENIFVETIKEGSGTNVSYNITNDTTYPWIQLADGTYKSQTQGVNSSTTNLTVTFTLTDSGAISFDYSVSSESASYDYLYYTITNSSETVIDSTGTSNKIGGTSYGTTDDAMTFITKIHNLEAGSYTVVFTYTKDSSDNKGTDAGYVRNIKVVENPEIIIETLPAGQLASTTGNITGVYDMSGGAYEYVMGNYGKTAGSSGLTVSGIPAEHIDIYSGTSVSASHLGDALGETAGWYSDNARFVYSSDPWFVRGGIYISGDVTGVFNFDYNTGGGGAGDGFRVALSTTGA